jgi:ATP-dependent DNA helicase RecG
MHEFGANASDRSADTSDLGADASDLSTDASDLPERLRQKIASLSARPRKEHLWPVVLWLCWLDARKAEYLATLLNRREAHLKTNHLSNMRKQGLLDYRYPEVVNHPDQAYKTTEKGAAWLKEQGVELEQEDD